MKKIVLFVKESTYFAVDLIVNVEIMCLLNAKSSILLSGLFDWEFSPKLWQTSRMCGGANWQEANVSNVAVESSGATFYLLFVLFKSLPTIWPYWRLMVLTKYHWHIWASCNRQQTGFPHAIGKSWDLLEPRLISVSFLIRASGFSHSSWFAY